MKNPQFNNLYGINVSKLSRIILILISFFLTGCGQNYEYDYKEEKNQRIATEQQLNVAKSDVSVLTMFLRKMKV